MVAPGSASCVIERPPNCAIERAGTHSIYSEKEAHDRMATWVEQVRKQFTAPDGSNAESIFMTITFAEGPDHNLASKADLAD